MSNTMNSFGLMGRFLSLTFAFATLALMGQEPPSTQPGRDPSVQDNARTQSPATDLVIGPGDLLQIGVYGAPDFNEQVRVSSEGEITLPLIG